MILLEGQTILRFTSVLLLVSLYAEIPCSIRVSVIILSTAKKISVLSHGSWKAKWSGKSS